jgi:sulfur carrier protein
MMNIQINGKVESFVAETLTVSALLVAQKVDMPEMVSVEVNGDVLDRDAFGTTVVKEGDTVEFLYFMGGGRA